MERIYRTKKTINYFGFHYGNSNPLYLFPTRYYSHSSNLGTSNVVTSSEQWCKEKKAEIYKKGFTAVFKDMSLMKDKQYFAITNSTVRPLALFNLKNVPGIYMITNKVNKKFYIGMSRNLYMRFYNYLNINRLKLDGSSRINKALVKYGFQNFSITILELPKISGPKDMYLNNDSAIYNLGPLSKTNFLRDRENFFIKVFKPPYNIKRYLTTREIDFVKHKCKVTWEIPVRIKTLLDKCLDPSSLDYNLVRFKYYSVKRVYWFIACTPKGLIEAYSSGWFKGKIVKPEGYSTRQIPSLKLKSIIRCYMAIDQNKLKEFYTEEKPRYVKNCLLSKIKALEKEMKKEEK